MNQFLELSIEYAQQRSYLDDLYSVYHTIPNGIRDINQTVWLRVEKAFNDNDKEALVRNLLDLDLFPLKDSYVAFLRNDRSALSRNPKTVSRLACEIMDMGLDKIYECCSQPKEKNRQMGPMFKNWIRSGRLGFPVLSIEDFTKTSGDAVLDAGDAAMKDFAEKQIGYSHAKGLDLIARVNGHYVIGEAKFLTDSGGHQNTQFNDAISTLECGANAIKVAILDGVLYIKGKGKMYEDITTAHKNHNIMSALLLRNFLYSI